MVDQPQISIVGEFTFQNDNPYSVRQCIDAWSESGCGDRIDREFLFRMSGWCRTYWIDGLGPLAECMVLLNLAESKSEAKKFIKAGAVKLNGRLIKDERYQVSKNDLLYGLYVFIKKGKGSIGILMLEKADDSDTVKQEKEVPMAPKIGTAVLLFDDQKRILLAKRISTHENGKFGCPGGKLEFDESILQAAARELYEETHMRITTVNYLGFVANCAYPVEGNHFLCVWCYAFVDPQDKDVRYIERDANGNPKSEGWEWYTREQLETMPLMMSTKHAYDHYIEGKIGQFRIEEYRR